MPKRRQAALPVEDEDIDFDMDTEQAKPKPDSVFFQIVSAKPGQRKILRGGRRHRERHPQTPHSFDFARAAWGR